MSAVEAMSAGCGVRISWTTKLMRDARSPSRLERTAGELAMVSGRSWTRNESSG